VAIFLGLMGLSQVIAPSTVLAQQVFAWGDFHFGLDTVPESATNVIAVATGFSHNLVLRADGTVVAWGDNSLGQLTVPEEATNVVAVAAGSNHSLLLRADGRVFSRGDDSYGQATVPANATNVIAIAGGDHHSLALLANGTIIGWGDNFFGQASAPAGETNLVAIGAGGNHSLALRRDGTILAWGASSAGQLLVPTDATNVVAISAGIIHNLALRMDGTVFGWGNNFDGQSAVPSQATNATTIAAGAYSSFAIRGDGAIIGWGDNRYRHLDLPLDLTNGVVVASGGYQTLVLLCDPSTLIPPTIWRQPSNETVVLGDSAVFTAGAVGAPPLRFQWLFEQSPLTSQTNYWLALTNIEPAQAGAYQVVVANDSGFTTSQVATLTVRIPAFIQSQPESRLVLVGTNVTFQIIAAGDEPLAYRWQKDGVDLGDTGSFSGSRAPALTISDVQFSHRGNYRVVVSNAFGVATSTVATLTVLSPPIILLEPADVGAPLGGVATFVVSVTGTEPFTYQWQREATNLVDDVRLGGITGSELTITGVRASDAAGYQVVVSNTFGSVTSRSAALAISPILAWGGFDFEGAFDEELGRIPLDATNVVAISTGANHSLALREDQTVVGWGWNNDFGQATIPQDATNVVAIAAGAYHSLALRADGSIVGWGNDSHGQSRIPANATNAVAIAGGANHSLALRADGEVVGWGSIEKCQSLIPGNATNVVAIAAGGDQSLALRADGTVLTWGSQGDIYGCQSATRENVTNAVAIAAGTGHGLALLVGGVVVAWGSNDNGQTTIPTNATEAVAIAAGESHSIALRVDGTVINWGSNFSGQSETPANATNAVAIAAGGNHCLALASEPSLHVPPVIGRPPIDRVLSAGDTLVLRSVGLGRPRLTFQWLFNGIPSVGQTNSWFAATNVQREQSGAYQVIVANDFGSATSTVATVIVTVPPPIINGPTIDSGNLRLGFATFIGADYVVEYQERLEDASWAELVTIAGTGDVVEATDFAPLGSSRFYRVRVK